MTETAQDLDAYIGSTAALLGISTDPSWRNAIRFHLELSLRMARLVGEFTLSDEAEPAPVFTA